MISPLNLDLKYKGQTGAKTIKEYLQLIENKIDESVKNTNETSGSITLETGMSFAAYSNKIVNKNNRVSMNLAINGKLTKSSTWIKLGTIKEGFRPTNNVYTVAFSDMIDKPGCPIRIESNGGIYVLDNQSNANACIRFSIVYDI